MTGFIFVFCSYCTINYTVNAAVADYFHSHKGIHLATFKGPRGRFCFSAHQGETGLIPVALENYSKFTLE